MIGCSSLLLWGKFSTWAKAVAVSAALIPAVPSSGGVIHSTLPPTQDTVTWPYPKLSFPVSTSKNSAMSLADLVSDAHRRYQDSVFFEGPYSVYNPSFFPADRWEMMKPGDHWFASSGGWNTVILNAPLERPVGVFGQQVIYDATPHTPGLYQFTVIDWSQWPFRVEVTHYAWVNLKKPYDWAGSVDIWYGQNSSTIPNPGSALLLLGGASLCLYRKR